MGIQIGSFIIPYYGLLIAIGIIFASVIGYIQVRAFKMDSNDFTIIVGFIALGGIIGAKLLYIIVSLPQIDWSRITDWDYFNSLMSGGFVFYGGLIGGLLMLIPCNKLLHIETDKYVKICIPCVPIVHAFGRFGCSLVGCCYGVPHDGFFSITYHNSLFAPNNISLFPVQATEALLNIVTAVVLLVYIHKNKCKTLHTLPLYLFMYATIRFVLEFFRYDFTERGFFLALSTSQWISIGFIITAAALFFINPKKSST